MEKIIRDGCVAVAVSRGHGAGWSTWSNVNPMDAEFNQLFIDGKWDEAIKLADCKGHYSDGIPSIVIEWVPVGERFEITECDYAESLRIITPNDGYIA